MDNDAKLLRSEIEPAIPDAELIDAARQEVEAVEAQLDPGTPGRSGDIYGNNSPLPDSFPGYLIVREIHRGGQGVVYHAIQEATQQSVAIKVMKEGPFSGRGDRARFDREITVLGQLHHPNIVTIHDSGSVAGCFFFVMNYIPGQPLDVYMASGERTVQEILTLFVTVCDAVNAAHLRGVIHRDLKPGNILIDEESQPYVLDFGLAKMVTTEDEFSAMTLSGQFVGSLPWASPEQAEGVPSLIDIRTDVYSLGIMLYQVLTGKFPYNVVGPMREVLDRIVTVEPKPPSTHKRSIDTDLDTIILKCLSKDSARRYQSAGELGRDIRHYLANEPIEARRNSTWYVFRKSIRRHRAAVAVSLVFIMLLAGFGVGMSFMYSRAREETRTANQVLGFLQRTMTAVDPMRADQGGETLKILLDRASERLVEGEVESPLARATIHYTLGNAYFGLRDEAWIEHYEKAIEIRRNLLGSDHPDTVQVEVAMVRTWGPSRRYLHAEPILKHALAVQQNLVGPDRIGLTNTLNSYSLLLRRQGRLSEAETLMRESVSLSRELTGKDSFITAVALINLAVILQEKGELAEAETLGRQALEIARQTHDTNHAFLTEILFDYVPILSDFGKHDLALQYGQEALEIRVGEYGEDHIMTVEMGTIYGRALTNAGRFNEALPIFEKSRIISRQHWRDTNTNDAVCHQDLARALRHLERYVDAEPHARQAVDILVDMVGDDHLWTADAKVELGELMIAMNQFGEAETLINKADVVYKSCLDDTNPRCIKIADLQAEIRQALKASK